MSVLINFGALEFLTPPELSRRGIASARWRAYSDGQAAVLANDGVKLVALVRGEMVPHRLEGVDFTVGYRVALVLRGVMIPPQELVEQSTHLSATADKKCGVMHAAVIRPGDSRRFALAKDTVVLLFYLGKKRGKDRREPLCFDLRPFLKVPAVLAEALAGEVHSLEHGAEFLLRGSWGEIHWGIVRMPELNSPGTEVIQEGGMMSLILNNGGSVAVEGNELGPGHVVLAGTLSEISVLPQDRPWCATIYCDNSED